MNWRYSILGLFAFYFSYGQTTAEIDSINAIRIHDLKLPFPELITIFEDNLANAEAINYLEGKAEAHYKLSLVYSYKGDDPEQTTSSMLDAIRIYESINRRDKMAELYGLFGYGLKRKDLPKAMYYMQKGMKIAKSYNLDDQLKDIYNNYGVLKQWNTELDSAAYYFKEGLRIKQEMKDEFGIPYSLSNLAGAYLEMQQHQKAKDLLKQSIELRIVLHDSVGLGENYTQLAEVYFDLKDYEEALPLFMKSAKIANLKQYKNLEQYAYQHISDIFLFQNQADSALTYYKKYIQIKDEMQKDAQEAKVEELTIAYEIEKKDFEIKTSKLKIQRKNSWLYASFSTLFLLGLLAFFILKQQRLKNSQLQKEMELKEALSKIQLQNELQEQRFKISRDLHDNIGAQLSFIISSLDNLKMSIPNISQNISERLTKIGNFSQQTIVELRDTIWAMNKEDISFEDFKRRVHRFVEQTKDATKIDFDAKILIQGDFTMSSLAGVHLYRIVQEAVHNAIKHAKPSSIELVFSKKENLIHVLIADDGIGFDMHEIEHGNGLYNMQKRAQFLEATIQWEYTGNLMKVMLAFPEENVIKK